MFKKDKLLYLLPPLIVSIILLIMFYFQGLYPFGSKTIIQVDADYQYVPMLYKIWDIFHNNHNIFFDFLVGNNIYTSLIIQGSIFSPITLLVNLVSRSNIINFFNILVIIKMSLLSLTSYIYFKNTFQVKSIYHVIFSICYAFSGWVLLNYFNIMWLDDVILFPLIVLFLDKLLKEGKYIGYLITLTLSLIFSYYISIFILLFILIYSFIYINLNMSNTKSKKAAITLGITTLLSILISSFSIGPAIMQTINSSRLDGISNTYLFNNTINKLLYLMFNSVLIIYFIKLISKIKSKDKNIYFYVIMFILLFIGVIFEPINIMFHLGSYWSFPYRYSFLTLFIMASGGLYYIEKYITDNKFNIPSLIYSISSVILLGISIYLVVIYHKEIMSSQITLDFDDVKVFKKILLITIVFCLSTFMCSKISYSKLKYVIMIIISIIEITSYTYLCMHYESGYFLTTNTQKLYDNIKLENNNLTRYKIDYPYVSPDYSFILGVPTVDNWLHIIPSSQIEVYKHMGYYISGTLVRTNGGTIFTDNLLNINNIITNKDLDEDYILINTSTNGYNNYQYKNTLPYGLVIDNKESDYTFNNIFEYNNYLYKYLFNKNDNLIDSTIIDNIEKEINDNNITISFKYNIDYQGYAYLDKSIISGKLNNIYIDDNYLSIPESKAGLIYLGNLTSGKHNITITLEDITDIDSISIGSIDRSKYIEFVNTYQNNVNVSYSNNKLNINVLNNEDNKMLFLPINNIKGYQVIKNNKIVNSNTCLDNFMCIDLDNGNNDIVVKYHDPYIKIFSIISLIGIVLTIVFKIYDKVIINNNTLGNIALFIYLITAMFIMLFIYLGSIIMLYL